MRMISTGFDRHLSLKVIILLARLLLREMSDDFTSKENQGRELSILSSISLAALQNLESKYGGILQTTALDTTLKSNSRGKMDPGI